MDVKYLNKDGIEQTISDDRYRQLADLNARFELWRNGRTSYHTSEVPKEFDGFGNAERSAMEVWEFVNNPPDRYFGYVKLREGELPKGSFPLSGAKLTTWTGDALGQMILGISYRDNFGGLRHSVTVRAINGKEYYGTYYRSAGDYCRLKLKKSNVGKKVTA